MSRKAGSVQLPKELISELLETSLRFQEVVEMLEVQLDKETVRRLKEGERARARPIQSSFQQRGD